MKSFLRPLVACTALVALSWSCANTGTPSGGPKDIKPPVVVSSIPAEGATDFNGKTISITFDENIQLTDADSKFVMSPPTSKKPKVSSHAKTVTVTFEDDLLPATTYTLDFADCLSDLNEGNVYEGFTLSFSTGESTDSMMISGNLYDAETTLPLEGIYVLLHSNLTDTAFTNVTPIRIAKTDANGRFAIKNIPAEAQYDIYALDDQNRNFLFDQPGEKIAWLGHHVTPSWEIRQVPDSVKTDSTYVDGDSVRFVYNHFLRDTLTYTPDSLILFAFDEFSYDQYIASDERTARNTIKLTLNKPMQRRPKISFVDQNPDASKLAKFQFSPTNDTVMIWMTDTTIWKKDSVVISVNYLIQDSLKNLVDKIDTLKLWHFDKPQAEDKKKKRRRKKDEDDKPKKEMLKLKIAGSVAPYGEISITSENPFDRFDWRHVYLQHKVDTIFEDLKFVPIDDTLNICHKAVKYKWIAGDSYRLIIDSAAVSSIYGLENDSTCQTVNITALDKYGTLYIDVDSVPENALLQLVDSKGTVVRQNYLKANGKAGFKYLTQGDYMIRILIDDNKNGIWDPGNFAERRQPESYIYYMEKVTVRQNWDIHVIFETNLFTPDRYNKKFNKKSTKKKKKSS